MGNLNFGELSRRLVASLKTRVRSGEMTERGLARQTGVSQPHIHHVLSGKRTLSPELADQILQRLHMDLLDLLEPADLLAWRSRF